MPLINRGVFQLGLILLCVPTQYFLTTKIGNGMGRTEAIFKFIHNLKQFQDTWFRLEPWKEWWKKIVSTILEVLFPDLNDPLRRYIHSESDTCLPVEVIRYNRKVGYFGSSTEPRADRPLYLRFRIGQVVQHYTIGYRAVVIGWDLHAKAPAFWLNKMYGESKQLYQEWPHYVLLVDERDAALLDDDDFTGMPSFFETYVGQDQLVLLRSTEIQNSDIKNKFDYFDGAQYIPDMRLKTIYPKD